MIRRAALFGMLLASCGSGASPTRPAQTATTLRIEPASAASDVNVGATPPAIAFHAFAGDEDVTSSATWTIDDARLGTVNGGAFVASGIGGHGKVTAARDGSQAAADVALRLTGDTLLAGATAFAPSGTDTSLVVEYPPDGVVIPGNLPPIEFQTPAGPTTFRARLTSSDVLDVAFYSPDPVLAPPADVWSRIGATAPDQPITLTIASADGHASAPRTLTITSETIAQGAVYAHDCENGGLVVLDFLAGGTRPLATQAASNTASEQHVGHCAGCHDVSHDGRRIAFAFLDNARPDAANGPLYGGLRFDDASQQFTEVLPPNTAIAVATAFNPLEAQQRPAMMTAYAIPAQTVSGIVMLDPDTGAAIPGDNLSAIIAAIPDAIGHGATSPAWSNHGDRIVFSAYPNPNGHQGMEPAQGSLVETAVTYDGTNFQFGAPAVLVPSNGATESNARATFNDDDSAFAFMRVTGTSGAVLVQRHADGAILPLAAGAPDPNGAWDTRLPAWGASSGARYSWIVVASNRPYGHRSTQSPNSASVNRYQLWMFAVDRAKLAAGTADPSLPALWLPGQDVARELIHPLWPTAMLSR